MGLGVEGVTEASLTSDEGVGWALAVWGGGEGGEGKRGGGGSAGVGWLAARIVTASNLRDGQAGVGHPPWEREGLPRANRSAKVRP